MVFQFSPQDTLKAAVEQRRVVEIEYQGVKDEKPRARAILPYLIIQDKKWRVYVWAYCFKREDARTFRLDRISSVYVSNVEAISKVRAIGLASGTKLEYIGLVSGDVLAIVQ